MSGAKRDCDSLPAEVTSTNKDSGCSVTLIDLQWYRKDLECTALTAQPATYCVSMNCTYDWMAKTDAKNIDLGLVNAKDTCKAQAAASAANSGNALTSSIAPWL